MNIEPELDETTPNLLFEKPAKGRVIEERPLAQGLSTPTDNSLIGLEKSRIIQWEKSIQSLEDKIKGRKVQIKLAKKRIRLYEKAAALK